MTQRIVPSEQKKTKLNMILALLVLISCTTNCMAMQCDPIEHFSCSSGDQCLWQTNLCMGFVGCTDKSDLRWCKDSKTRYKQTDLPKLLMYRCNKTLGNPGQQIPSDKVNDGKYHCLGKLFK